MAANAKTKKPKHLVVSETSTTLNWYSLGKEVLRANGVEGTPIIVVNSVNPDQRQLKSEGRITAVNTQRAIPAIKSGEILLTIKTIPGHIEHLTGLGLVPATARIIEVEPKAASGDRKHHYPYSDALELLKAARDIPLPADAILVAAHPSPKVSEQARELHIGDVHFPDSFVTNNKRLLRESSELFGFSMLPGIMIATPEDITKASSMFEKMQHGAWLKYEFGLSGSLVRHIPTVTHDTISLAIRSIRRYAEASFKIRGENGGMTIEEFWPKGQVAPTAMAFVLESDARNHGRVVVNGNTQVMTYKSGEIKIVKHTRQRTSSTGSFMGSTVFFPDPTTAQQVDTEAIKATKSNMQKGYYGVQGVDWFLIDNNGIREVFITEINARWNGSTYPTIVADKLGAEYWTSILAMGTKHSTSSPINIKKIDDFVSLVGTDLAFGDIERGLVLPLIFRSYVGEGKPVSSPDFTIQVIGTSTEHCEAILRYLNYRGVRTDEQTNIIL